VVDDEWCGGRAFNRHHLVIKSMKRSADETDENNAKKSKSSGQCWLMKAEAETRIERGKDVKFSIDDLQNVKVSAWDGVRNYQARNIMRDDMKLGDKILFYHSNTKKPINIGVVGIAKVCRESHPDESAFDIQHPYFDEKSSRDNPRWFCVDVEFVEKLPRIVTLAEIKANPDLKEMVLVKRGRLSVQPVTQDEFDTIVAMSKAGT
jgi:predicted RNA-binding protein with PUA-like domain